VPTAVHRRGLAPSRGSLLPEARSRSNAVKKEGAGIPSGYEPVSRLRRPPSFTAHGRAAVVHSGRGGHLV